MKITQTTRRFISAVLTLLLLLALICPVGLVFGTVNATQGVQLTNGQQNIVKRAYQMTNIQWTPRANITGWGGGITYQAGKTYTGLPYGQPVYASYVPWSTSLSGFVEKVNDPNSKMYTSSSTYNKAAPYYSIDCSAFVSWAWGLSSRQTTSTIHNFATKISTTSYAEAEVGDCLCLKGSHVVLITDITYDAGGAINGIEISESTVNSATYYCCQKTRYGVGGAYTLDKLTSKYFGSGYILYRSKTRDRVTYSHCCAVPLEGDACDQCGIGAIEETPYETQVACLEDVPLYTKPDNNADQIGTVYAGAKISVVAYWEDEDDVVWYKTADGHWVPATQTAPVCEHSYQYRVSQLPTCTENGTGIYVCIWCSDTYSETLPARGHDYVTVTVAPDCENPGYTENYCQQCGDYFVNGETAAAGHDYQSGVCVVCGAKDPSVTKGDLNGDGEITSADSVLLARFLAELLELNGEQRLAADINGDGEITSADAVLLARQLAGL